MTSRQTGSVMGLMAVSVCVPYSEQELLIAGLVHFEDVIGGIPHAVALSHQAEQTQVNGADTCGRSNRKTTPQHQPISSQSSDMYTNQTDR